MQISYDLGYFIEYADGVHDPDSACWASLLSTMQVLRSAEALSRGVPMHYSVC